MSSVAYTPLSAHKMPQLDALRALAALSVLFAHFIWYPPYWLTVLPLAAWGVQLFFVLSGFLITGILLDGRTQGEAGGNRFWILRQFYVRRFLRIFPLYYAVIFVGRLADAPGFTKEFGWNLAYLTNFYLASKQHWIGPASHLWTLSVEEQFYFIWPWIVLFVPRKWFVPAFVGTVIFAIVYRVITIGWFEWWLNLAPFGSLDCFGMGALLALADRREQDGDPRLRQAICTIGLWLGATLLILAYVWHFPLRGADHQEWNIMTFAMALLFTPLISRASRGFSGLPGFLFTRRPILYVGKISYGIYIYHWPTMWLVGFVASRWIDDWPWFIPRGSVFFLATLLMAAISWHFFERPINQLKRLFPYRAIKPEPEGGIRLDVNAKALKAP